MVRLGLPPSGRDIFRCKVKNKALHIFENLGCFAITNGVRVLLVLVPPNKVSRRGSLLAPTVSYFLVIFFLLEGAKCEGN